MVLFRVVLHKASAGNCVGDGGLVKKPDDYRKRRVSIAHNCERTDVAEAQRASKTQCGVTEYSDKRRIHRFVD